MIVIAIALEIALAESHKKQGMAAVVCLSFRHFYSLFDQDSPSRRKMFFHLSLLNSSLYVNYRERIAVYILHERPDYILS
jgi:hypothetical protein